METLKAGLIDLILFNETFPEIGKPIDNSEVPRKWWRRRKRNGGKPIIKHNAFHAKQKMFKFLV